MNKKPWLLTLRFIICFMVIILVVAFQRESSPNQKDWLKYLAYPENFKAILLNQEAEIIEVFAEMPYCSKLKNVYREISHDMILDHHEVELVKLLKTHYPETELDAWEADFFVRLISVSDWQTFFDYTPPTYLLRYIPIYPEMMQKRNELLYLVDHPYVPVLMYHMLDNSYYWINTASFKWQLEELAKSGFSTIRADAFMRGDFSAIPEGRKPVLLTFDDGRNSQFRMLENGQADPESGVGILELMAEKYPAFGKFAVFYIYLSIVPFGVLDPPDRWKEKINYLQNNGFEIGNHTYDHQILTKFPPDKLRRNLDQFYNEMDLVEGCNIAEIMTLCYPGGEVPRERQVIENYEYKGLPLLGCFTAWGGKSLIPIHPEADQFNLPRYDGTNENIRQITRENFFTRRTVSIELPDFFMSSLHLMKYFIGEYVEMDHDELIWNGYWISQNHDLLKKGDL
jgi:peptidoglycan/xylan/chitin deacetylase (PgdA/CDA1 family)